MELLDLRHVDRSTELLECQANDGQSRRNNKISIGAVLLLFYRVSKKVCMFGGLWNERYVADIQN